MISELVRWLILVGWIASAVTAVTRQNHDSQAKPLLEQQVAQHPNSYQANHLLGELYVREKNYSSAVVYLQKAYRLEPNAYDNAYDLALSQLLAGDTAAARQLVEQLMRGQERPELHNLLGSIEEGSGNFREAAKEYETAARLDPSEKNLFDLGTELLKYHGYQQALKIFTYSVNKQPASARLRVGLGVAQYSLGLYGDAVETLCKAVDLDPKDTRALEFLGKMYDVAPELSEEVTRRLKHFANLYPANPAANYYYGLALRNAHPNNNEAEGFLQKAVKENPSFADAHYQLALAYGDAGLDAKAIEELRLAVQLRPEMKSAHYRLAQLYSKEGKIELAHQEYARVKSLGQTN